MSLTLKQLKDWRAFYKRSLAKDFRHAPERRTRIQREAHRVERRIRLLERK